MACPQGTIRYDIFFRTFPDQATHVVKVDELLTFCLLINGPTVTGTVNSITNVTGTNQVLTAGVERISLSFPWGNTKISLDGFTFPGPAGRRKCVVEFSALQADGAVPLQTQTTTATVVALAPDVGDTGTGTGTQT